MKLKNILSAIHNHRSDHCHQILNDIKSLTADDIRCSLIHAIEEKLPKVVLELLQKAHVAGMDILSIYTGGRNLFELTLRHACLLKYHLLPIKSSPFILSNISKELEILVYLLEYGFYQSVSKELKIDLMVKIMHFTNQQTPFVNYIKKNYDREACKKLLTLMIESKEFEYFDTLLCNSQLSSGEKLDHIQRAVASGYQSSGLEVKLLLLQNSLKYYVANNMFQPVQYTEKQVPKDIIGMIVDYVK